MPGNFNATPTITPTPVCGQALAPRLVVGEQAWVTPGMPNNLREQPGQSGRYLGEIPPGGVFTVLEGPLCGGGLYWWRVNYNGTIGWTPEADADDYWLEPLRLATANPPTPTPR